MLTILASYRDDGFVEEFHARPGGVVECGRCHVSHRADALELHRLERLEGDSDPAEMLAICAVTCPACGSRGTLVLTYGPEATPEDDDVLALLDDERRRRA